MGARYFSFCLLLLRRLPLGASLTVEYPSKSVLPLSGEDGGKFLGHSFASWGLGGLPHRQLVGTLMAHPHPMSSTGPILTATGEALPTNSGLESNSLEARLRTGLAVYSTCNHCLHLSDAAIMWCQCKVQPHHASLGYPFVIWQPIWRPHLLESVYKPMRTPH